MRRLRKEQICILTAPYLHHTLAYGLDSIAANGFLGVELWGASPHYCIDDYTPEERAMRIREIRQMLKDRGLKLMMFHPEQCRQYPINIASPINYIRKCSLKVMESYLEDTRELGTDKMILTPGWEYVDAQNEENFKRAVEGIHFLDEKARMLGVKLYMEEMDVTSTVFLHDMNCLQRMVKAVDSDNIKICMDMVLAAGNGESVKDYYNMFGGIDHVHFADTGSGYMVPGNGSGEMEAQLKVLAEKDYEGAVSIALWGAGYFKDPDMAMRQCSQWLKICNVF